MNLVKKINTIKFHLLKIKNLYSLVIITIIFFLDRYSKIKILNNLSENNVLINDFVSLNLIWNTGIGFGLLNFNTSFLYNLVTILVGLTIIVLFYITILSEKIDRYIFSIIIGGALGNFYDRLIYNAVPDFIDLHYENYHWFIFNLADIFITLGIIIFLMKDLVTKKSK
jgi:signal peptidase II